MTDHKFTVQVNGNILGFTTETAIAFARLQKELGTIPTIKAIRLRWGMGLFEAKHLHDAIIAIGTAFGPVSLTDTPEQRLDRMLRGFTALPVPVDAVFERPGFHR